MATEFSQFQGREDILSWICRFMPAVGEDSPASPECELIHVLDQCGVGAIVLDGNFRCLRITSHARLLVSYCAPFQLREQRLFCPTAPLAFRRSVLYGLKLQSSKLSLEDSESGGIWQIHVIPVPGNHDCTNRVLLLIREGARRYTRLTGCKVRAMFDLTRVESELVAELVNGMSTKVYAETRHVSIHTVRNQLKSVFVKLDLHSQKDLIAEAMRRSARV